MSIIGYHKADKYIITIETEDYRLYLKNEDEIINSDYALYETKNFNVIDIEDLRGEHYDKILDFVVDETYNYTNLLLEFFKIKELAFYIDFILKKQWEIFPDGYTGLYKEYLSNGAILIEYFHINGKKYGECKYYRDKNKIHEIIHYVNDVKFGEYIEFYINGKTKTKGYFSNNHLQIISEYDCDGNIL
jgi:antitoxin component YwqK of YwqJK toxin-antitoxin module